MRVASGAQDQTLRLLRVSEMHSVVSKALPSEAFNMFDTGLSVSRILVYA